MAGLGSLSMRMIEHEEEFDWGFRERSVRSIVVDHTIIMRLFACSIAGLLALGPFLL